MLLTRFLLRSNCFLVAAEGALWLAAREDNDRGCRLRHSGLRHLAAGMNTCNTWIIKQGFMCNNNVLIMILNVKYVKHFLFASVQKR